MKTLLLFPVKITGVLLGILLGGVFHGFLLGANWAGVDFYDILNLKEVKL